jgi:hypothetical protein
MRPEDGLPPHDPHELDAGALRAIAARDQRECLELIDGWVKHLLELRAYVAAGTMPGTRRLGTPLRGLDRGPARRRHRSDRRPH